MAVLLEVVVLLVLLLLLAAATRRDIRPCRQGCSNVERGNKFSQGNIYKCNLAGAT